MSVQLDESQFSSSLLQEKLPQYYRLFLREFRARAHRFVSFNVFFCTLLLLELIGFTSCFSLLRYSTFFAIAFSTLLLTLFSYCVLFFYYSAQKPDYFLQIKERFARACQETAPLEEEGHALAAIFCDLSSYLDGFETRFYQIPDTVRPLAPLIHALSGRLYRKDLFVMKEILLQAAIQAHLSEIRTTPTLLELHASLANTYLSLAKMYREAKLVESRTSSQQALEMRFQTASKLAIEEFLILRDYAPSDPWVYEQLAAGYRTLRLQDLEIQALEALRTLRPHDQDALFRLGVLYFETQKQALGLRMYEALRALHVKKAEELILFYSSSSI